MPCRWRSCRPNRRRKPLPASVSLLLFSPAISRSAVSLRDRGTALPPVAFHTQPTPDLRARIASANTHGAPSCIVLPDFLLAFMILFGSTYSPAVAQDKSLTVFAAASMKNALDDVDAAYTAKTGVKVIGELCRKLGARQADRTGRAGRHFRLRRYRLDGLCDRQEEHQRADPGQSARQQHRADRAEGFQDRQRDDRARLRSRQARRRRQDRDRRRQGGAGRQIRQGRAGEARRLAGGGAEIRDGRERARRAGAGGARRGRARHRLFDRRQGRARRQDRRHLPGRLRIPPIIYPVAATATAKPDATGYLAFLRSSAAKAIFEKYGFKFLVSPTT